RAYCLKTQPATGETYPKSDLFNKAPPCINHTIVLVLIMASPLHADYNHYLIFASSIPDF
ncbi:TPA: hypothetical protein ACGRZQ_004086, partial [Enterobacter hormaechei]